MCILHGKRLKSPCTLCVAAAYCCGAVALLALLLPSLGFSSLDLGRFFIRSGPFFFSASVFVQRAQRREAKTRSLQSQTIQSIEEKFRVYSAAAWNGPRSPNGIVVASTSASTPKSDATCAKRG